MDEARNNTSTKDLPLREVASEGDDDVADLLPLSIRTILYQKRRKQLPPLPGSREDVQFNGEWAKTSQG